LRPRPPGNEKTMTDIRCGIIGTADGEQKTAGKPQAATGQKMVAHIKIFTTFL